MWFLSSSHLPANLWPKILIWTSAKLYLGSADVKGTTNPLYRILLCDQTFLNRHVILHYTIPKPYIHWKGKLAYQGVVGALKTQACKISRQIWNY